MKNHSVDLKSTSNDLKLLTVILWKILFRSTPGTFDNSIPQKCPSTYREPPDFIHLNQHAKLWKMMKIVLIIIQIRFPFQNPLTTISVRNIFEDTGA